MSRAEPMQEDQLDLDDIQGHVLVGFPATAQHFLGLKFKPRRLGAGRKALLALADGITSAREAAAHRAGACGPNHPSNAAFDPDKTFLAMSFSRPGLAVLGAHIVIDDPAFDEGAAGAAATLGDPTADGSPVGWVSGDNAERTPDVFLIFAAEAEDALSRSVKAAKGALERDFVIVHEDRGARLDDGREHFGFRDGTVQPGVRGCVDGAGTPFTPRLFAAQDPRSLTHAAPGQPLMWPGQVVFGYRGECPRSSGSGPVIGAAPALRNGSLLVFRRLRQDVAAFRRAVATLAVPPSAAEPCASLAAGSGRCHDHARQNIAIAPNPNHETHAVALDQLPQYAFDYGVAIAPAEFSNDTVGIVTAPYAVVPGHSCPNPPPQARRAGGQHSNAATTARVLVRGAMFADRALPRRVASDTTGEVRSLGLEGSNAPAGCTRGPQMLRRPIPYGDPFDQSHPEADRGLLFLSYQTSITHQFHALSKGPDDCFQARAPGLAQGARPRRWVATTAAGYFFAPGLSTVRRILTGAGVAEHSARSG